MIAANVIINFFFTQLRIIAFIPDCRKPSHGSSHIPEEFIFSLAKYITDGMVVVNKNDVLARVR